jgi:hypothetical protein
MKILLEKSKSSIEASSLLKQEEHFASSIHCSYYSCIQLMRHILFNIHNEDEAYFDRSDKVKSKSSHEYLLNQVVLNLHKLGAKVDLNKFRNNFRDIKELRKNADYKQIRIFERECNIAYAGAKYINHALKDTYNL